MKQPAINSVFHAAKHYSQSAASQDKDYIVTPSILDAVKPGVDTPGKTKALTA